MSEEFNIITDRHADRQTDFMSSRSELNIDSSILDLTLRDFGLVWASLGLVNSMSQYHFVHVYQNLQPQDSLSVGLYCSMLGAMLDTTDQLSRWNIKS